MKFSTASTIAVVAAVVVADEVTVTVPCSSSSVTKAPVFTTSYTNTTVNATTPAVYTAANSTSVATGAGAHIAGSMLGAVAVGAVALLI